jgi:hypothetical protein
MGNPGHPDLILAEFQAKARAGELLHPIEAVETTSPWKPLLTRWAILGGVGVLIALLYFNWLVTTAVAGFLLLAAAREIWVWRRESADAEVIEEPPEIT